MEYLFALLLITIGVYKFDLKNHNNLEKNYLRVVFLYLISLSAFQYMVGCDIKSYMEEYEHGYRLTSLESLIEDSFRQPGWVLLVSLCRFLSSDFLCLKIVQALFVNIAVYRFIATRNSAKFTIVLFYFVFLYLNLNFNILRESFAIAIFLISYPYLEQHKWCKYYLMCFVALMFHLSAILLFVLPFVKLIRINYKTIVLSVVVVILLIGISLRIGLNEIMLQMAVLIDPESALYENSMRYLDNDRYSDSFSPIIIIFVIVNLLPIIFFVNRVKKNSNNRSLVLFLQISLLYFMFDTLNRMVPILYRFNQYFMLIYFSLLTAFIFDYLKRFTINAKSVIYVCIVFIYLFPAKNLFVDDEYYGYPQIVQYYPYHSIFSNEIDPVRKKLFY